MKAPDRRREPTSRIAAALLSLLASAACDGPPAGADAGRDAASEADSGHTPSDGGEPDADAGTLDGVLTEGERSAIEAQLAFELEQMNVLTGTASAEAIQHTLVIRPAFPWMYFTNDMSCIVNDEYPEGCRSGTSSFNPNFAFDRFEPAVAYAYEWAGAVGSLAGTASFELTGTPTSWLDARPTEPNDDALILIREHVESLTITEDGATFVFVREATKDLDILREGEPIRLRHIDLTTSRMEVLDDGARDVRSVELDVTFTDLRETDVLAHVSLDASGVATGDVRIGARVLAIVSGTPFASEPLPLELEWAGPAAPVDLGECVPACDARTCGREPACASDCGPCTEPAICSPAGACEGG